MSKLIGFACAVMVLFLFGKPQSDRFSKYRAVEAYEIRSGILMMPSYASDGQLCQIELEKRHYSNETAFLDPKLPHEVMMQIIDELVPPSERGPQTMNFGKEYMSAYSGNSVTTFAEYKNVSIDIYREASSAGDVVAMIRWKNQGCPLVETAKPSR
jgi:hypothetical protein